MAASCSRAATTSSSFYACRLVLLWLILLLLSAVQGWMVPGLPARPARRGGLACQGNDSHCSSSYEETPSEQLLRQLWEEKPFTIVKGLVDSVLKGDSEVTVGTRQVPDANNDDNVFATFYQGSVLLQDSIEQKRPTGIAVIRSSHSGLQSFALELAYKGECFCGWQRQQRRDLPSVQQSVEDALALVLGHKVDVRVAGRTDAGVHAVAQVARVRTRPLQAQETEDKADWLHQNLLRMRNSSATTSTTSETRNDWICLRTTAVSRHFHPTFGTRRRSYVYMLDGKPVERVLGQDLALITQQVDSMLRPLEGQTLDYVGLSFGKVKTQSTLCMLYRARAVCVATTRTDDDDGGALLGRVLAIELTGDRFLRRMVRILVSAALDLAVRNHNHGELGTTGSEKSLLLMIQTKDRTQSAKAAPAAGVVFVGAK